MLSTLVLNASYEPLSIVSAKRAVLLLWQNKASSLDDSDVTMTAANGETLRVPYVLLLHEYKKVESAMKPAPWSRKGVLARDGFRCVYCGDKATTIDHVIPQSKGGLNSYENCVAACQPCNLKKGDKSLKTLGWSIPFVPKAPPTYAMMLGKAARSAHQLESWGQYFTMFSPEMVRRMAEA